MKQLIFDCDGVIVDSEIEAAKTLVAHLEALGVDISVDYHLKYHSGRTFKAIFNELIANKKISPSTDVDLLILKIEAESYANIKPIKDIAVALEAMSLPKAVVSNSRISQIKHALTIANITQYFGHHIFSSTMVNRPKPHPDVYLRASEQLKVAPYECLVIEDSVSGVSAAVAAGMKVIAFTGASHILKGHEAKVISAGAMTTFGDMNELPGIVEKIVRI